MRLLSKEFGIGNQNQLGTGESASVAKQTLTGVRTVSQQLQVNPCPMPPKIEIMRKVKFIKSMQERSHAK